MERIESINPDRIAWCCADYGITPDDLASEVSIAASSMEAAMAGDEGLTFAQLSKIADFFGRGVLFFLEDGPVDEAKVHTPAFRTLANQKPELSPRMKKLIERAERQREVYLSLLEDLDESDRQQFNPPDVPANDPPRAAAIAREWLGLGETKTFDSFRDAVEAKGILVIRSNGYKGKWQFPEKSPIHGFALYDETCPVIVVRKQSSDTRQSFTLMHELGHLLMHRTSSIDDEADLDSHQGHERDANAFAGHVLVPDNFLATIVDGERPSNASEYDKWLELPRKAWGVSTEVILRRLMDTGRLSRQDYTAYRRWCTALPVPQKSGGSRIRHREPRQMFGDTFVRTVFDALNARQITLVKASSHLDDLKIGDLHRLESLYAGI
jgi:Zn-dependent peptidase ImmA (M78 family)